MVYRAPDDVNRFRPTKNCACFGSATSGRKRSPVGKASPFPAVSGTPPTAPDGTVSAAFTSIATPRSSLTVESDSSAAFRRVGSSPNKVMVATPFTTVRR